MDNFVLQIFQGEVKKQCKFCILALQDINQDLLDIEQGLPNFDLDRFWYSIQNFLVSAANISKILWPYNNKMSTRGNKLREILQVNDDSPLKQRTFRNHFEHFDERIEEWALLSKAHNFVDTCIGPTGAIGGVESRDFIRNFDTTLCAITFRGDIFYLKPLANSITDLWKKVNIELEKP